LKDNDTAGGIFARKLQSCQAPHIFHWVQGSLPATNIVAGASLPLLLAPTNATVATTSGRCLLQRSDSLEALVPLAVAGPGPFGVGVGSLVADSPVWVVNHSRGVPVDMR